MQCAISAHSYRRRTLCILAIVNYLKIFDGLPIPVHPLLYPDFTRRAAKIFFFLINCNCTFKQVHNNGCQSGGNKAEETAHFVTMFNNFFDCLNVRSFTSGQHGFKSPYWSSNFRLTVSTLILSFHYMYLIFAFQWLF